MYQLTETDRSYLAQASCRLDARDRIAELAARDSSTPTDVLTAWTTAVFGTQGAANHGISDAWETDSRAEGLRELGRLHKR